MVALELLTKAADPVSAARLSISQSSASLKRARRHTFETIRWSKIMQSAPGLQGKFPGTGDTGQGRHGVHIALRMSKRNHEEQMTGRDELGIY
ncbi:MAG: hypothetical protein JWP55_945 [Mycobacterium sp.]|nr:hypothetical protein [Mycobacterium sp.]